MVFVEFLFLCGDGMTLRKRTTYIAHLFPDIQITKILSLFRKILTIYKLKTNRLDDDWNPHLRGTKLMKSSKPSNIFLTKRLNKYILKQYFTFLYISTYNAFLMQVVLQCNSRPRQIIATPQIRSSSREWRPAEQQSIPSSSSSSSSSKSRFAAVGRIRIRTSRAAVAGRARAPATRPKSHWDHWRHRPLLMDLTSSPVPRQQPPP